MNDWPKQQDEGPYEEPPQRQRNWTGLIIFLLVLAGAAAVGWYVLIRPRGAEEAVTAAVVDAGSEGPKVSLADGDALLRKLAAQLSKSADLLQWLSEGDMIRRIAAAINLVSTGDSPTSVLTFIPFKGEFEVEEQRTKLKQPRKKYARKKRKGKVANTKLFIAPESYERYDGITNVFTSVDFALAGKLYGEIRPYFEVAFGEIGRPDKKFDDVLAQALKRIMSVKVPEGPVEVQPHGAVYGFVDPSLESLSAAEKHLIRMGPKNAKAVQSSLKLFADTAGISL